MSRFPLPAAEPSASDRWSSPEFGAELRAWVEPVLGPVRLEQFKLRGWATVLKVYAGPRRTAHRRRPGARPAADARRGRGLRHRAR